MTDDIVKPPALEPRSVPARKGSGYPAPFSRPVAGRVKRALGGAAGLTQFGVNLVELPPGAWSSQRHWHSHEDEFVYILEGELALVTGAGEQLLRAGQAAGFPAGVSDGHHLVNRTDRPARYLEVGARSDQDEARYPDIDLDLRRGPDGLRFTDKQGRPY